MTTLARRLDVYVGGHCPNCADALALADEAAARFSDVVVRVIDLDLDQAPPPDTIVAVPTFVLDGRTVSLGNPDPEQLFARLREAIG
jgi:thioredoxin family protein